MTDRRYWGQLAWHTGRDLVTPEERQSARIIATLNRRDEPSMWAILGLGAVIGFAVAVVVLT